MELFARDVRALSDALMGAGVPLGAVTKLIVNLTGDAWARSSQSLTSHRSSSSTPSLESSASLRRLQRRRLPRSSILLPLPSSDPPLGVSTPNQPLQPSSTHSIPPHSTLSSPSCSQLTASMDVDATSPNEGRQQRAHVVSLRDSAYWRDEEQHLSRFDSVRHQILVFLDNGLHVEAHRLCRLLHEDHGANLSLTQAAMVFLLQGWVAPRHVLQGVQVPPLLSPCMRVRRSGRTSSQRHHDAILFLIGFVGPSLSASCTRDEESGTRALLRRGRHRSRASPLIAIK